MQRGDGLVDGVEDRQDGVEERETQGGARLRSSRGQVEPATNLTQGFQPSDEVRQPGSIEEADPAHVQRHALNAAVGQVDKVFAQRLAGLGIETTCHAHDNLLHRPWLGLDLHVTTFFAVRVVSLQRAVPTGRRRSSFQTLRPDASRS